MVHRLHHWDQYTLSRVEANRVGETGAAVTSVLAYAGGWCGQHLQPPSNALDDRIISGTSWLVENVLDELNMPGEFYFDPSSKLLYLYPNITSGMPPDDLRFAILEMLISIEDGAHNITIENIGF
jgi:hypothetical protein